MTQQELSQMEEEIKQEIKSKKPQIEIYYKVGMFGRAVLNYLETEKNEQFWEEYLFNPSFEKELLEREEQADNQYLQMVRKQEKLEKVEQITDIMKKAQKKKMIHLEVQNIIINQLIEEYQNLNL